MALNPEEGMGPKGGGEGIPLGLGLLFYLVVGSVGAGLPLVLGRWGEFARLVRGEGSLLLQAALGTTLGLILVVLSRILTERFRAMKELERALAALVGSMGWGKALALALASGLGEEILFRGALLDLLGPWWSTLLFALAHQGPGKAFRVWTLLAALAGGLFAWMVLQGHGLASTAAAHAALNFLNLLRLSRMKAGGESQAPVGPPEPPV